MNTNGAAQRSPLANSARGHFVNALLLVSGMVGMAWSSNAHAIFGGCEIQPTTPTTQSGAAGTDVTFDFQIIDLGDGDCFPSVSGTVSSGSDSTGGASASPTIWSGTGGDTITITVTLGPTGGGSAAFTVNCTGCFNGNLSIDLTANTTVADSYTLTTSGSTSRTILTGEYTTINAYYLKNGLDANNSTDWAVSPSGPFFSQSNPVFTDDSTGLLTNSMVSYSPGTFTVTVDPVASECSPLCPPQISYTVTVEDPVLTTVTPASGAITIPPNSSTTLKVKYAGATLPVADGTQIDWNVTSEPALGAGTFSPQDGGPPSYVRTTTTGGFTQVTFAVTDPGTYTVQAGDCPDGCNSTVSFTITVPVASPEFTVAKTLTNNADGDDSGTVTEGDVLTYTVTLHNSGTFPLSNAQVLDQITSPSTTTCASLAVDADCVLAGTYTVKHADAINGTIQNTAYGQVDEIEGPQASNTLHTPVVGMAGMSVVKTLSGNADGDNSNSISEGDVLTYKVAVTNSGTQTLHNVVISDPITTPAIYTCPVVAPNGHCTLLGTYTVTAADAGNGSISNTGNATATEVPDGVDSNTLVTPIGGNSKLSLTLVLAANADGDGSGSVSQGDVLTFTLTARNISNQTLTNVVLNDATITPDSITCASLAIGADCVLTGTYTVTAADASNGSLSNTGTAQAAQVSTAAIATVVTAVVPLVRSLQIIGGNGQVGTPGEELPAPFTVRASDNGEPASGVGIVWTITSGEGSLAVVASGNALVAVNGSTDSSGIAAALLTLDSSPGEVTVTASRQDDSSVSVSFSVNAAFLGGLSGLNPKQKALADAIDKFCFNLPSSSSNSDVNDLRERCEELIGSIYSDPSGVLDALDQLFPDIGLVLADSSLLAAQSQFENIKARIAALRSGTQGTSFGGLALSTGRGSLPIGLAFQSLLDGDQPAEEVGSDFSRWGFFAAGTIGRGNADPGQINPGYDFDINGLTLGADYRKSDKFILGGTVGYTKQSNDLAGGRGKLDTSGYSLSAFSTFYKNNSWYLDDVLSFGRNSYDMVRNVHYTIVKPGGATTHIDQVSHGSSNGDSLTFAASVGRDFNKGGWSFGPFLRTIYSRLKFDPLTESFQSGEPGMGLDMVIDTHDVTSLSSTLGAKLTFTHSASWGVLVPHLQAEWQHEFKTDPASVTAYFLNDPSATPFSVTGDPIDSDFFRLGVGLSFVLTHGRSGFIYYEKLLSRDRISQDSLAFGLRLEF